jgi:hypothetical protein
LRCRKSTNSSAALRLLPSAKGWFFTTKYSRWAGFEASAVDGVPPRQVLLQQGGGPLAKAHALRRLDTVADRDDDIEAEEADGLVGAGNVQILHIALALKFFVGEHVPNVAPHDGAVAAEQLRHLLQTEPDGLPVKPDLDFPGRGLVDRDLGHVAELRKGLAPRAATWRLSTPGCYEGDGTPPIVGATENDDPGRAAIVTLQCPDSPWSASHIRRPLQRCRGRFHCAPGRALLLGGESPLPARHVRLSAATPWVGAFERAHGVWVICPAIGTRRSCSCRTHSEARNPYHAGNGISTKSCATFANRPMLYGVLGNLCGLQFGDLAGGWMVLPGCLS